MSKHEKIEINDGREGHYNNLHTQLQSYLNENYDCRINESHKKVETAMTTFTKHIANEYKINKLHNFDNKMLVSYVDEMKSLGYSTQTIKTYVSSIQDFSRTTGCKNKLQISEKIFERCAVPKRVQGALDRTWSKTEYDKMISKAYELGRKDVVLGLKVAKQFGLRIEGATTLSPKQINKALETGELCVKEKGGKPRAIPVETEAQEKLLNKIKGLCDKEKLRPNDKIFRDSKILNKNKNTKGANNVKKCQKSIQNFIAKERDGIQDKDRKGFDEYKDSQSKKIIEKTNLTFHGLRYFYAKYQFEKLIKQGKTKRQAEKIISEWLGHGRAQISRIYLIQKDRASK